MQERARIIYEMIDEKPRTRHELVMDSDMSAFRVRFALRELYLNKHVWKDRNGTYHTL